MQIYPAIDLYQNQCVRLYKGKFDQATLYNTDPIKVAQQFEQQGANWLHVVDLDAAKNPQANQREIIKKLVTQTSLNLQAGGGIRTREQIKDLLVGGVSRVVIGSQAVNQPETVKQWFNEFGTDKLVLALDIKFTNNNQPLVATQGWQTISEVNLYELIEFYQTVNMQNLLCTDINCDGALTGPNINLYASLSKQFPQLKIQASGGVSKLNDLDKLKNKVSGVIIGRALYEEKFTLATALEKAQC